MAKGSQFEVHASNNEKFSQKYNQKFVKTDDQMLEVIETPCIFVTKQKNRHYEKN